MKRECSMPQISIIVPIYNVEKYLNRCVDSILNQTFTNFECILVDDGSPDRCPQICDEYAKKDKRIRVIHKPNGGLSDARNAGIEVAQGEYLSFIDSDDWIHPQMLEILYEGIAKNNVMLSVCAYEEVKTYKNFDKIENPVFEIRNGMDFLIENNVTAVIAPNKLYHKSLFENIRYPVGKIHEDEFVTYKILYKSWEIAYCGEKLYMYFVNSEGITKGEWSPKHLDLLDALEERIDFLYEKGEDTYLKRTFHHLHNMTMHQYGNCKKDYKYECNEMKKRVKKIIRRYKHILGISLWNDYDYYYLPYPKLYIMIYYMKILLNKLKRWRVRNCR